MVEKLQTVNIEFGENVSLNEKLWLFILETTARALIITFFFLYHTNVGHVSVVLTGIDRSVATQSQPLQQKNTLR